jgi:hypothetical protein
MPATASDIRGYSLLRILWYDRCVTISIMKIGVSLPDDLVAFADERARDLGMARSELLASLLRAERVRQQTRAYLDRHGWDVADDEAAWRRYQRRRIAEEYRDDQW